MSEHDRLTSHATTTWTLPLNKADFDIWAEVAAQWAALIPRLHGDVPDD